MLKILLLCFLLPANTKTAEVMREWRVTEQSTLTIQGSSNVNEFECASVSYSGRDVLQENKETTGNKTLLSGMVVMKAGAFDCQNKIMTHDLQKTLQTDKYPDIKVRFFSLKKGSALPQAKSQKVQGLVEISLVGITQQYEIEATFIQKSPGKAALKGSWEFSFSDFQLEPPTKMMGAIRVNDCLQVNFNLDLQIIQVEDQDTGSAMQLSQLPAREL